MHLQKDLSNHHIFQPGRIEQGQSINQIEILPFFLLFVWILKNVPIMKDGYDCQRALLNKTCTSFQHPQTLDPDTCGTSLLDK